MQLIEKLELITRAYRYKNKNDIGGIKFLRNAIEKNQTALDIGAHKAGYLYWMRKCAGKSGKIIAFEPQNILFQYLQRIKKIFNWDNVDIANLALSNIEGEATLYIPANKIKQESSPSATIVETIDKTQIQRTETTKVQSLDNFCGGQNIKPNFIKIDVEGNELNVLRGGITILSKYKPKLLIEIELRHAGEENVMETFAFLQNLGYKGHFLMGAQRVTLSSFNFEIYQNINDMKNYCNNFTFEID